MSPTSQRAAPKAASAGLRLSVRVGIMVFLAELVLLGGFAATVYLYSRKQFYRTFDDSLRTNAQALASCVDWDSKTDRLRLEFAEELSRRFSRSRPDLFVIWGPEGEVIASSRDMAEPPDPEFWSRKESVFASLQRNGRPYRGVCLTVVHGSEDMGDLGRVRLRVFFAASFRETLARLEDVAEFLASCVAILLFISGPAAWFVARRGLRPLRRMARQASRIGERSLHLRLPTQKLPADLLPMANSVNTLLERAQSALERERQFSSDVAHELRTPVSVLKSGIQSALLTARDPAEDQRALEDLLQDVTRIEKLCESLLAIAAHEAPGAAEARPMGDWISSIGEIVRQLAPLAESQGSRLAFAPPPDAPPELCLGADEAVTQRIALNLIENAIRHGGPGTRTDVQIAWDAEGAELRVQDDGAGVKPEDEPRMFDRFFRADDARSRSTGGAGLGLAICQTLAKSVGGTLRYERPESGGSRFVWRTPFAPSAA